MQNYPAYNKLFGQMIGSGFALGTAAGVTWLANIDVIYVEAISALLGGAFGTYFSPPNRVPITGESQKGRQRA